MRIPIYDTIVIGGGSMGSAAAYEVARRGRRVLVIEREDASPHEAGSHHGYTRIIRLAYYEDPAYVALLQRAYALWREIEADEPEPILHITGSLDAGPADGWVFGGALQSAQQYGLAHAVLTAPEVRARFPAYHLPAETLALWQPDGGFVVPERAIATYLRRATALGAATHFGERTLALEPSAAGVRVVTDRGRYEAGSVILTPGAWLGDLAPSLAALVVPERQVLAWLEPTDAALFQPDAFPVFNLEVPEGRYYGLPVYGIPGFKFGRYRHLGETGPADTLDLTPRADDEALLRDFAARYFPAGNGPTVQLRGCLFTNTPDGHFIIDRLPELPGVIVASACSGHGFKFASVIGEILAELAVDGSTRHDIALFRLDRFAAGD